MNVEAFFEAVMAIRRNKQMLSNSFLERGAVQELLDKPQTIVKQSEGLLVLLQGEPTLYRAFFYADGEAALRRLPELVSGMDKQVVVDIVGKDPKAKALADKLMEMGFAYNSTFVRLVCKEPVRLAADTDVVLDATPEDVPHMLPLLQTEFSPLYSHFPEEAEFLSAVDKGEIAVIRENGRPVAMAYFEAVSPRKKCLRYYIVDKSCRGKGYGAALLMREFSREQPEQEYYLWIGTYNPTQKLYARVGFVHDGLNDYILTL